MAKLESYCAGWTSINGVPVDHTILTKGFSAAHCAVLSSTGSIWAQHRSDPSKWTDKVVLLKKLQGYSGEYSAAAQELVSFLSSLTEDKVYLYIAT